MLNAHSLGIPKGNVDCFNFESVDYVAVPVEEKLSSQQEKLISETERLDSLYEKGVSRNKCKLRLEAHKEYEKLYEKHREFFL